MFFLSSYRVTEKRKKNLWVFKDIKDLKDFKDLEVCILITEKRAFWALSSCFADETDGINR